MEQQEKLNIDQVIKDLLENKKQIILTENTIVKLCLQSKKILKQQPVLLELTAPLKICGDVHGQYQDLLSIFNMVGFPGSSNFLFLGDYVDRGKQSLETICLLLAYKIKFPENFFLLRGNHECASINRIYGFYDECKRRYNLKLWKVFTEVFNQLPIAALIEDRILCMHGGLSPDLTDINSIKKILRPTDIPDSGMLCDLLWSDPDDQTKGWGENERGVSYIFGSNILQDYVKRNDLDLICRAHQVVEDGYEFFNKRNLVTIFSAPNYCGDFDNDAAIMNVTKDLICSFKVLKSNHLQNKKPKAIMKKVNQFHCYELIMKMFYLYSYFFQINCQFQKIDLDQVMKQNLQLLKTLLFMINFLFIFIFQQYIFLQILKINL